MINEGIAPFTAWRSDTVLSANTEDESQQKRGGRGGGGTTPAGGGAGGHDGELLTTLAWSLLLQPLFYRLSHKTAVELH